MNRNYKPWTKRELKYLQDNYHELAIDIANELGRTKGSIRAMKHRNKPEKVPREAYQIFQWGNEKALGPFFYTLTLQNLQRFCKFFASQKRGLNRFRGRFYPICTHFCKIAKVFEIFIFLHIILFYSLKVVQFCKSSEKHHKNTLS